MNCILCGGSDFADVHDQGRTGPLATVACERCGLVQHAERPTPDFLAEYYGSGQYRREFHTVATLGVKPGQDGYTEARDKDGTATAEDINRRIDIGAGTTVYEIGAGDCSVTRALRRMGLTCHPIEMDKTIATEPTLDDLPVELPDPSLVIALQVLEHAHDPIATLHDWLRAGRVYVEVPTVERPYGSLSHFFQFPHLQSFSRETLAVCGLMAGADEIQLEMTGTILCAEFRGRSERRTFEQASTRIAMTPGLQVAAWLRAWEAMRLEASKA